MTSDAKLGPGRTAETVPALVHLLRKLSLAYLDAMARLAVGAELHQTDLRALIELLDAERRGQRLGAGDLGRALAMTTQATTALVTRLEDRGLVIRRRSSTDGRRVELLITPHALDVGWRHFGPMVEVLSHTVEELNGADRALVENFVARALDDLEGLTAIR